MQTYAPRGKIFGPILPQFVLEKSITLGAKVMYALLCNYASETDHCWPSQATLAAKLSCSVSSVKNYLAELVREKLIEIRHEQYRSCVYYMLRPGELDSRKPHKTPIQSIPDCPESEIASPEPKSGYLNNLSKQEKKNPPLPPVLPETPKPLPAPAPRPVGGGVSLLDFEKAWESYPKKEAKSLARTAWLHLQRIGQLPLLDEIQASIRRFAGTESWQREQGRFIPQMGNWLRGQRWLDPVSTVVSPERESRLKVEHMNREFQEREEANKAKIRAEMDAVRPLFTAFAEKFRTRGEEFHEPMVFGLWMYQHRKNQAPTAYDVPDGNALPILDFLKAFQRQRERAAYLNNRDKETDRISKPVSCLEAMRNSAVFSQLFSAREAQLCAAV